MSNSESSYRHASGFGFFYKIPTINLEFRRVRRDRSVESKKVTEKETREALHKLDRLHET